jgi:hypothetical protein
MKTEDFNIKFKENIIKGTHKVTWNNLPVRIICWDRKGEKLPNGTQLNIVALADCGTHEKLLQVTNDGITYDCETQQEFKLKVTYDAIGYSKQARVAYSLLLCPCIEKYMRKYGYKENKEKGWHWNAVEFANKYAKTFTNELHKDLKDNREWKYDDDYDWE